MNAFESLDDLRDYVRLAALLKRSVLEGHLPRYLYKYRPIDDNLTKIITGAKLRFSSPLEFNDPFDCKIAVDADNTKQEIEQFIRRTAQEPMSDKAIRLKAREWYNKPGFLAKHLNEAAIDLVKSIGVCCFAVDSENLLLWSHYGNGHTGVCLKFDILADLGFFAFPQSVIYGDSYPVTNHFREPLKIGTLLIHKSSAWAYEREVRVVKQDQVGLHSFNRPALVEIIFGCRVKEDVVQEVKEVALASNYERLRFSKACVKERKFGFDFHSI
jgi:Protein of unknown function (DUF2971)